MATLVSFNVLLPSLHRPLVWIRLVLLIHLFLVNCSQFWPSFLGCIRETCLKGLFLFFDMILNMDFRVSIFLESTGVIWDFSNNAWIFLICPVATMFLEVKSAGAIKRPCRLPQLCRLLSLERLTNSEHAPQSLINTSLFGVRS